MIQGRLFDVQGRPVQGVAVSVEAMGRVLHDPEGDPEDRLEGPDFLWRSREDLPAWPRPATTDADGRFTVRGVGRSLRVVLMIDDPRFARQRIEVDTDSTSRLEAGDHGRGTGQDHHRPRHAMPTPASRSRMPIVILSDREGRYPRFETDAEGRFRANPVGRPLHGHGSAPAGTALSDVRTQEFEWPKGAVEHPVDLALPRGVVIRGKVTEEGSGKPVAGAMLSYLSWPTPGGSNRARGLAARGRGRTARSSSRSRRPGYLIVLGPSDDYVLQEIGERMIQQGQPGGRRCTPTPSSPAT